MNQLSRILVLACMMTILPSCTECGEEIQTLKSSVLVSAKDFQEATDLPLNHPMMIVMGPERTILISDHRNGRIVQVDLDGRVTGVLQGAGFGGRGFVHPTDIDYNEFTNMLWVVDRTSRLGVYQYSYQGGRFILVNQTPVPSLSGLTYGTGIVSELDGSVWVSPKLLEYDLVQYNTLGMIQRVVGNWWIPNGIQRQSLWIWNMTFLFRVGRDSIGVAWVTRPIIEILNLDGVTVAIDSVKNSDVEKINSLNLAPNQVREYCFSATYCNKHGWLIGQPRSYSGRNLRIYLTRVPSTGEITRFTGRLPRGVYQVVSVICTAQPQPEFIGLDRIGGQLVVFRPAGAPND